MFSPKKSLIIYQWIPSYVMWSNKMILNSVRFYSTFFFWLIVHITCKAINFVLFCFVLLFSWNRLIGSNNTGRWMTVKNDFLDFAFYFEISFWDLNCFHDPITFRHVWYIDVTNLLYPLIPKRVPLNFIWRHCDVIKFDVLKIYVKISNNQFLAKNRKIMGFTQVCWLNMSGNNNFHPHSKFEAYILSNI